MSSEMFIYFGKYFKIFLCIVDLNGSQQVEGPNYSFNAASKNTTQS